MSRTLSDTCRICGSKKEYARLRNSSQFDIHKCEPVGCAIAASRHVLTDGTLCPDERHQEV